MKARGLGIVLALTGMVLVRFTATAQRFQGGVFLGLSTTQVSGDQLAGFNKTGFLAGGLVSTGLGKNFDLALEIMYIEKGSRRKPNHENDSSYLLKLTYFEVPLLLGYTYKKRLKLEAGPSFGKLLSSSESDQNGEIPRQIPFKDMEISINGGISYRLWKGLYVHTRIATSVIPIRPHASGETYYFNRGQYNTVLFFDVKYLLPLGGPQANALQE